jgi:hypothetical protein
MRGRVWMAKDTDTLMTLARIGCDDAMIALQTGHCVETVRRHRRTLGLEPYYRVRHGTFSELRASALTAIALGCRVAA